MSLTIVIGAIGISFVCAYMLFKIGDRVKDSPYNVHYALQIILYSMVVMGIFIAGTAAYNTGQVCSFTETNTTVSGNVTSYNYNYLCTDDPDNTGRSLFSVVNWFLRLMFLYLAGFVIYSLYKPLKEYFTRYKIK